MATRVAEVTVFKYFFEVEDGWRVASAAAVAVEEIFVVAIVVAVIVAGVAVSAAIAVGVAVHVARR